MAARRGGDRRGAAACVAGLARPWADPVAAAAAVGGDVANGTPPAALGCAGHEPSSSSHEEWHVAEERAAARHGVPLVARWSALASRPDLHPAPASRRSSGCPPTASTARSRRARSTRSWWACCGCSSPLDWPVLGCPRMVFSHPRPRALGRRGRRTGKKKSLRGPSRPRRNRTLARPPRGGSALPPRWNPPLVAVLRSRPARHLLVKKLVRLLLRKSGGAMVEIAHRINRP